MTPEAIAADPSLHRRFLTEIAYLDRPRPSDEETSADLDLLASSIGGVVIAWLWPHRFLDDAHGDPFDNVGLDVSDLERRVAERLQVEGIKDATDTVARLLDQRRNSRRQARVKRFEQIVASTAQAVDRPVEDLLAHLRWSVPLTERELGDLVLGRTAFPLGVIAALGRALQFELDTSLVLVDPERLVRRIDESMLALSIADHLRRLTVDNLEAVRRKLPRGSGGAASAEPRAYVAPEDGARYSALYEVLAGDERDHLRLTLDEIDRILADGGERPLPASARTDRSWWAGTGAKPQGRPQISAWWGAGYRVFSLETDRSSGHLTSVGFEALPGRASWLADVHRGQVREYRAPEPYRVPVFPWNERLADNVRAGLRTFVELAEPALRRLDKEGPPDEEVDRLPSDPDVRLLVELAGRGWWGQSGPDPRPLRPPARGARGRHLDH